MVLKGFNTVSIGFDMVLIGLVGAPLHRLPAGVARWEARRKRAWGLRDGSPPIRERPPVISV